jgi:hypothetical protein
MLRGDRVPTAVQATIKRQPDVGQIYFYDRGGIDYQTLIYLAAGIMIALPLLSWAGDITWTTTLTVTLVLVLLLGVVFVYGLLHTGLAICERGLIIVHPLLTRFHHLVLPYSAISPNSIYPVNRLGRIKRMVDGSSLALPGSHYSGSGLVFVGPGQPIAGRILPEAGRSLWCYNSHRPPNEVATALREAMTQAGWLSANQPQPPAVNQIHLEP